MLRKWQVVTGIAFLAVLAFLVSNQPSTAQAPPSTFANFEGSQTNPIRLSADGTRLFAVNTPNGTLSVFDLAAPYSPANPHLMIELPVGLEPVSVNPVSDDVAWVVNEASNSVSVVSVSKGIVTNTINFTAMSTPAAPLSEPTDVVFAGGQAYVSVSRSNLIAVFNESTLAPVSTIPVFGGSPRTMAVSPDQSTVYAAFAIAGNATTIIGPNSAPPQPPPINKALPPPPQVALIVQATDPAWKSQIKYTMPDNGVVAIKTGASPSLAGYYSFTGTLNMGLGVNPVTGDLYVGNTQSLNLIHFEDNLCGHYSDNRITRILVSSGQVTPFDLNPNVTYGCASNPLDLSIALAQPTAVTFDPSGSFMYVAAFGTDRVAKVDTGGHVLSFVEVAQPSGQGSNVDPSNKRGPRGLALDSSAGILYSLNRISDTISIINTAQNAVTSEIPVGTDPTPSAIKQGRGFLYDAKLSGTGTASCSTCHVDGDIDHLAWDLGEPAGDMEYIESDGQDFPQHPMKGPMTTQTLRGLLNLSPYHWRGDKPMFSSFNGAFPALLGGPQISASDMANYTAFANSIYFMPNPSENLDRTIPNVTILGGNASRGQNIFLTVDKSQGDETCSACHSADALPISNPASGSNRTIKNTRSGQPMKIPQLRNAYQKMLFSVHQSQNIDGFGFSHDGHLSLLAGFLASFQLYSAQEKLDMAAYELCFDTGTAPGVSYDMTLTASTLSKKNENVWGTLQTQAQGGNLDLVGHGTIQGAVHGLYYRAGSNDYISDAGVVYTQAQIEAFIKAGDTMTIMGMYPGTGTASAAMRMRR